MVGMGLLWALALCSVRTAYGAERAVAPVAITVPLAAPAVMGPSLPGTAGWLGVPGLEWRGADSPAALAAQILLPPSAIVNFAAPQAHPDAAAFAPNQAEAAPSPQAAPSAQPRASASPLATGAESGVVPIEYLGEGSRPASKRRSQDRLSATESSLRAPLAELRDAPADGGESLHSTASRIWDIMSGRRSGHAFAQPSAGRAAFVSGSAAAGETAGPRSLPPSAADAPLSLSEAAAPLAQAPRLAPASIALVLMDVFGQRLNLTSAPVPRLEAGPAIRYVRASQASGAAAAGAAESSSLGPGVPAPFVPQAQRRQAPGQADLPSSTWRAEAEWVSFGESGQTASPSSFQDGLSERAAPAAAFPALARPTLGTRRGVSEATPQPRSRGVPPSAVRRLEDALPLSALVALAGLALLAWPEPR